MRQGGRGRRQLCSGVQRQAMAGGVGVDAAKLPGAGVIHRQRASLAGLVLKPGRTGAAGVAQGPARPGGPPTEGGEHVAELAAGRSSGQSLSNTETRPYCNRRAAAGVQSKALVARLRTRTASGAIAWPGLPLSFERRG